MAVVIIKIVDTDTGFHFEMDTDQPLKLGGALSEAERVAIAIKRSIRAAYPGTIEVDRV